MKMKEDISNNKKFSSGERTLNEIIFDLKNLIKF